jgi:hypothetical protein
MIIYFNLKLSEIQSRPRYAGYKREVDIYRNHYGVLATLILAMAWILARGAEPQLRASSAVLLPCSEADLGSSGKTTMIARGQRQGAFLFYTAWK